MSQLTDRVILGAVAGLLVYEAYTLANRKRGDTISESVWRVNRKRPLVPFVAGFVMGHFFWQAAGE